LPEDGLVAIGSNEAGQGNPKANFADAGLGNATLTIIHTDLADMCLVQDAIS
jgi:hypothetical protein